MVIAESATLKAGQCHPAACRSRKSTTWPKRRRSMTLPIAPPRISASPAQNMRRPGERRSSTETITAAPTAKATSSGVCQPGALASRLNAAPLLNTSTRLKKPVSSTRSPGAKCDRTSHFVSWSASTMPADTANQDAALDIAPRLARAAQVALAACAQAFVVHVRRVMPAAFAFPMTAGPHFDARLSLSYACNRGEHQELELVAQAREELVVLAVRGIVELRLERSADLVLRAQRLDLLAHRVAQLAQPLPLRNQLGRIRGLRQLVQGLEEHAVVALPGEDLPKLFGGEREDRRHEAHQAVRDGIKRALRGAPRPRISARGVEAILENIEVK